MIAQTVTFASMPVIDCDVILRRGTEPGVAIVRVPHSAAATLASGAFGFSAGNSVSLTDWVPDLATIRAEFLPDDRREFVFLSYDRRKTWSGMVVSGEYNYRYKDGTIKPSTEKTLSELYDICLTEVSEPTSTSMGSDAYPSVSWNGTSVTEALNELSKCYPAFICYGADDTISVVEGGTGDTLPDPTVNQGITPDFSATIDRGPANIRLVCGPTKFQHPLELEAVGSQDSYEFRTIDTLSYKPAAGWESQHPLYFSDVDVGTRQFAIDTVFRCYRVKSTQTITGAETILSERWQIDLDDTLVEMAGSGDDKTEIPFFVKGKFYPYQDLPLNTDDCIRNTNDSLAKIDNKNKLVHFSIPVYQQECGAGDCVCPADLWLWTGFRLRDETTGAYEHKEYELARSGGTGEQIIYCPWLWKTVVTSKDADCGDDSPTTNLTALDAEANDILNAWKTYWDSVATIRNIHYAGIVPLNLSGIISQVRYRLGRGLPPITVGSENYEPSL